MTPQSCATRAGSQGGDGLVGEHPMPREREPTRLRDALDWALVGAPLGLGLLLAGLLTFFGP